MCAHCLLVFIYLPRTQSHQARLFLAIASGGLGAVTSRAVAAADRDHASRSHLSLLRF